MACSFKLTLLVKRLPQRPQAKGLAPACERTCRSHDDCAPKPTWQAAQAQAQAKAKAKGFALIWREKPWPQAERPARLGACCAGRPERQRKVARQAERQSAWRASAHPARSPACRTAACRSSHEPRLKAAAAAAAAGDRRPSSSLTMTRTSSSSPRLTSTCRSSSFTRAISASSSSSLTRRLALRPTDVCCVSVHPLSSRFGSFASENSSSSFAFFTPSSRRYFFNGRPFWHPFGTLCAALVFFFFFLCAANKLKATRTSEVTRRRKGERSGENVASEGSVEVFALIWRAFAHAQYAREQVRSGNAFRACSKRPAPHSPSPDRKFGTPSAEQPLESIPWKASLVGPDRVVICSLASQASSEPVSREQRPPRHVLLNSRRRLVSLLLSFFLSFFLSFLLCLVGACCPGKMFKVQMLRALVNERLSAAVEEVFAVLERTIADYEEELCRTKEENRRQRQLLDAVFKAHAEDAARAPDAQGCPRVKEEEEEEEADEADLGKLAVTRVVVKSEDEGRAESEDKTASDGDAAEREGAGGGGPFACPRCDKSFGTRRHLKRHAKSHADAEGGGEPPFSCSACDMSFKFQSTFLGHMRKHSGGKSFPCGVCKATFRFRSTFVNHMRTHTGEKPFACHVCNASFGVHSSLLRHARLHTGEKRFACSFCDKKFPRKASLVEHVRIHTGEKPLACSVCHMRFRFHSKLVKHMRSHKGDRALDRPAGGGQTFESGLRPDKHACAGGESSRAQTRFKV